MMTLRHSTSWLAIAGAITVLAAPAVAQQAVPAEQQSAEPQSTEQGSDIADPVAKAAEQRRAAITGQGSADTDDSNIVVTGTRISRPNLASAAPITSVTVQDIQAQAPLNVEEVLNRLPQIAPDSQQNYQDSDGRQRIKLRSLGFERTLVLIDGKRLGTQNAQDTGIIPTSLLQRIDVLSGGASSVYGSDAISGVVNFVLRQDFDGLRIDGNYNFYNHVNKNTIVTPIARAAGFATPTGLTNDGGRADLTLTAGKKLFDDTLKISGFVNYRTADLVSYGARSTAPCYILQATKDGPLSCQLSTYSPSGYIAPNSGPNAGRTLVNNPDGTRTFVPYGAGANNAANPYDTYAHQRASERYTAGGFISYEIAREAELYGSAIWFRDKSSNPSPRRVYSRLVFGGAPYDVNCNNPFLSTAQATALCGAAAGTAALAQTDIRYRFEGQPYQANRFVNEGIRATGGIRGRVGEAWNYDIGGVYARNQQDTINAPFSDDTRVRRSLNVVSINGVPTCASVVSGVDPACVPFDAFRAGSGNAALTNYLFTGANGGRSRQVGSLYDVLATMTGDLTSYGITSPWAEQGLAISLGTEYRKDHLVGTADQAFRDFSGGTDSDLKQDVWESNIEAQLPVIQNRRFAKLLQVNGGFRLSKYSSNPDVFNTWKVEGIYAPVEDLTFRASFNKAQRAPTVVEINQATTISYGTTGVTDFCAPVARQVADPANPGRQITVFDPPVASRETCRATGLSDALYGSQSLICTDNNCTIRQGGFTADPETAYTQTYGIVVKPRFLPGLVFSVDRYQIRINNSLGYNGADYFSEGCRASNGDPFFCSAFVRNPTTGILYAAPATNPTSGYIRVGTNNYYRSISNGWDFQAQYTLGLKSVGRIDWSFNGSLTTLAGGQDSPNRPQYNCAGYFSNGISCGQLLPKWMHGLRTTYTTSDNIFNASFNWRYTGSLTSANNSGQEYIGGTPARAQTTFARIAPQSYFDLSLTFNIARQFALRFIANNLFDREPPIVSNSRTASLAYNNTLPQRYDSLGRQLAIGTTINF